MSKRRTRTITGTIDGVVVSIEVDADRLARRDKLSAEWTRVADDPVAREQFMAEQRASVLAYRARRWGHQRGVKRSTETRAKIADGAKVTAARKPRDTRGRFVK